MYYASGQTSGTPPSATLHKTDAANASVATLTGPSTTTGGNVTFNAPANTTLDASSTYFILLQGGSLVFVERTNSDSEDTGGQSGWTVLDAGHYRNAASTFAFLNVAEAKQIRVNGTAASNGVLAAPANFTSAVGDAQVTLAWDPPASDSGVTRHEYRFKTGTGSYPASFTQIANSAVGGATSFTVTGLTNELVHTFQLRAVNSDGDESAAAESDEVTPTPGICGRTAKVHESIVFYLEDSHGVERICAEVNVADLAGLTFLEARDQSIASLKLGDFAGLTSLTSLELDGNSFTTLPVGVFSGLTSLTRLQLDDNDLSSLPAGVFSGLAGLGYLNLNDNDLGSLPAGLLSGLTGLGFLNLGDNPNTGDTLPLTVTVEKVGTDQVRAKVLAGAPFEVEIPVTVANGIASQSSVDDAHRRRRARWRARRSR